LNEEIHEARVARLISGRAVELKLMPQNFRRLESRKLKRDKRWELDGGTVFPLSGNSPTVLAGHYLSAGSLWCFPLRRTLGIL
jgi:hypothetical protein